MSNSFSSMILIEKLLWALDEGFKISFVHHSPYMISQFHSNLEAFRWTLFLFKHLRTVLVEALLRYMCNVPRAPCIWLNLPLHLAAVCCTLQWTLVAEINKQLELLFATTLTLTSRHSDVTVVKSWH